MYVVDYSLYLTIVFSVRTTMSEPRSYTVYNTLYGFSQFM